MRLTSWCTALAVLATAPLPTLAQTPPPGRLLASNCFQCHGTDGRGPGFERLAGMPADELYDEMIEMRAGKEGTGLMVKHSMIYTDAQLRLIADWFAAQPRLARR